MLKINLPWVHSVAFISVVTGCRFKEGLSHPIYSYNQYFNNSYKKRYNKMLLNSKNPTAKDIVNLNGQIDTMIDRNKKKIPSKQTILFMLNTFKVNCPIIHRIYNLK